MPLLLNSRARRTSSLKWVLPPSMMMSPDSMCLASSAMVFSVGVAGRHHDPGGARLAQLLDEIGQRRRTRRLLLDVSAHIVGAEIEDDALMSVAHQALNHVAAHAPQTDHAQLHDSRSFQGFFLCFSAIRLKWSSPTSTVSAMLRNSPVPTTPGMARKCSSNCSGCRMGAIMQSRM